MRRLPTSPTADLTAARDIIEHKWQRHCPTVVFDPQRHDEDDIDDLWGDDLSGDMEDDIWGFIVGGSEEEGHYWLHALTLDDPTTDQLGMLGVWNEKDLIFVVPKTLLDATGEVVQTGDWIVTQAGAYEINEVLRWGNWRDTDEYLLVILNCTALSNERSE